MTTMTNEQHNKYIAWTFFGHAAFQLLMLLFMVGIFSMVLFIQPDPDQPPPPRAVFAIMIGFLSVFNLIFTLPSIIAGYALLKRKSWARMAGIVAGITSAMNVPIGTAACIYSLWFFLGDNWKTVYPEKPGDPRLLAHERESRWTGYRTDEKGEITFHQVEPPDWR